jgi:hypothetical protein
MSLDVLSIQGHSQTRESQMWPVDNSLWQRLIPSQLIARRLVPGHSVRRSSAGHICRCRKPVVDQGAGRGLAAGLKTLADKTAAAAFSIFIHSIAAN